MGRFAVLRSKLLLGLPRLYLKDLDLELVPCLEERNWRPAPTGFLGWAPKTEEKGITLKELGSTTFAGALRLAA